MMENLDRVSGLADAVENGADSQSGAALARASSAQEASAPNAAAPEKGGKRKPVAPRRSKTYEREFVPTNKHPVIELEIPLKTDPATRVFENTAAPAQQSLFVLQVILPQTSKVDTSVLDSVMEYVNAKFVEIESEMQGAMDRMNVLKNESGARVARQYFHAEMVTVQAMTPMFTRFIELIVRMDDLMQLVDSLWFARRLNDKQRAEVINQWRNRLIRFNRELYMLKVRAASHAEKIRNDARNKDEKKAAGKLKKQKVKEAAMELAEAKGVRGSDMADVEKGVPAAAA